MSKHSYERNHGKFVQIDLDQLFGSADISLANKSDYPESPVVCIIFEVYAKHCHKCEL